VIFFFFSVCLTAALVVNAFATDLNSIGGLVPLLGHLKSPLANIQAKAAEVVTTIVQNNPHSQQLVMEANGLEPLLSNFSSDPNVTAQTKALGAISYEYQLQFFDELSLLLTFELSALRLIFV
jgi:hypothetical protein